MDEGPHARCPDTATARHIEPAEQGGVASFGRSRWPEVRLYWFEGDAGSFP